MKPNKLHRFEPCTDVDNHPALVAWQRIGRGSGRHVSVEALFEKRKKRPNTAIFRLQGVLPDSRRVIAKQMAASDFERELTLYIEYFQKLSVPTVELLGWVQSEDGRNWLFLEDAGEVWYDPNKPDHRALAVEWMARLHTQPIANFRSLRATGLAYFRSVLANSCAQLAQGLKNPALNLASARVVNSILDALALIEQRWIRLENVCTGLPCSLVHGDFRPKNVRIVIRDGSPELIAFDWETSGVAFPAADIAMLPGDEHERRHYLSLVRNAWPGVRWDEIDLMDRVGQLFRMLHAIEWASRSLAYPWMDHEIMLLGLYDTRVRDRLRGDAWFHT